METKRILARVVGVITGLDWVYFLDPEGMDQYVLSDVSKSAFKDDVFKIGETAYITVNDEGAVFDLSWPGTPKARMQYLLGELAERFPDAHQPFSSASPEPRYMQAIDDLLKPGLIATTLATCVEANTYDPDRNANSIFNAAVSEIGELAVEINIENGRSYKKPGPDGVIGEAMDAILALLDLIYKAKPDITEAEMVAIASPKLAKWISKIKENQ